MKLVIYVLLDCFEYVLFMVIVAAVVDGNVFATVVKAVLKQLSGRFSHDYVIADEAGLQFHQQLQRLYGSTREAKHFQRHLVRGVEGLISASSKQMEIVTKLTVDCDKYGNANQSDGTALARASIQFGTAHSTMEKESEKLHRILRTEMWSFIGTERLNLCGGIADVIKQPLFVFTELFRWQWLMQQSSPSLLLLNLCGGIADFSEPLRTMIVGAPLEDARHLFHQYEHIRREVEAQAAEVARRRMKSKEADPTTDSNIKLQNAESKLTELRSRLSALGREATAAMVSVEAEQQQFTFQRLIKMAAFIIFNVELIDVEWEREESRRKGKYEEVEEREFRKKVDAERAYHQRVSAILDELHAEMVLEKQHCNSTSQSSTEAVDLHLPSVHKEMSNEPVDIRTVTQEAASSTEPDDLNANAQMSAISNKDGDLRIDLSKPRSAIANEAGDIRIDLSKSRYFIAKVIHSFDAQTDGELSLSEGDYVVVRQVAPNGWSEGECKGKAGWFPSAYVEQRDKAPASKVAEARS
ncbi:hypothetical protein ACLOJK_041787 [Asimina triloba]